MPLRFDYFERIIEAVEISERAYENGDMEEAAEYMEEVRHIGEEFLEELKRSQEEGEDE
jgi:flagellin-specific chaperone FliS